MMRIWTVFFFVLLMCPSVAEAQTAEILLQKVTEALSAGKADYAVSLFRQATAANAEQAEIYYWTQLNKNTDTSLRMAGELAAHFKDYRVYDKAYLFYMELLQAHPDDVQTLVACAETQLMRGDEDDARRLYEKVLGLDADNLQANIFLGNYYFLQAENRKKRLEEDFKHLASPTRMQYARYRNGLSDIFAGGYEKAKVCLQRVLQLFPSSSEAGHILERIKKLEAELK